MNITQLARELEKEYNVKPVDTIRVYGLVQDKLYNRAINNNESISIIKDNKLNNKSYEITKRYFRREVKR